MSSTIKTIFILFLLSVGNISFADNLEARVQTFMDTFQARYEAQDIDGMKSLCHPLMENPSIEILEEILKHFFSQDVKPRMQWTVKSITAQDKTIKVHLDTQEWHKADQEKPHQKQELFLLQEYQNELRLIGTYTKVAESAFQVGRYTSKKGKFSLQLPAGWQAYQGPMEILAITIDALTILAPNTNARITLGVIQLPLSLGKDVKAAAKTAVQTDAAMAQRMTSQHQILSERPINITGYPGYEMMTTLTAKIQNNVQPPSRQRLRQYFIHESILYFFVCDTIAPESFNNWEPTFRSIINSFKIELGEDGLSLQEALAAQGGEGDVTERTYTSEKYNCFLAAPEGWEIRTNPDPITLVEMRYSNGSSIARLIASKGIGSKIDIEALAGKRIEQLHNIAQNFQEPKRQTITFQDLPGVESIQTYSIDGLGDFHVKEVSLIRDETYYLILCQCISPDRFADLESDFDKIIESFGFLQQ